MSEKHYLESDIEKWMVREIRKHGGMAYKFVSPGHTGVPDRIVIMPEGVVIFTELKADTGRLSKNQQLQIGQLRRLGCDVRVIKGMDEAKAFIRSLESSD